MPASSDQYFRASALDFVMTGPEGVRFRRGGALHATEFTQFQAGNIRIALKLSESLRSGRNLYG